MSIAVVSGYWCLEKHKYDMDFYNKLFPRTLSVYKNVPLIMFCDEDSQGLVQPYCPDHTKYIHRSISEFEVQNYPKIQDIKLDETHVPSRELGMIWLEKIHMVKYAKDTTDYQWYCWSDAGNAYLREHLCEGNIKAINLTSGKFYFTISERRTARQFDIKKGEHCIAGTSWIIHHNDIDRFLLLFQQYYIIVKDEVDNDYPSLSDKVVWSRMLIDNPDMFQCVGLGYGNIINLIIT